VQAFVVAASEEDVETFCGLVTQSYRDQIELAHRALRQALRPAAAVRA
jgi:hypothetical protein